MRFFLRVQNTRTRFKFFFFERVRDKNQTQRDERTMFKLSFSRVKYWKKSTWKPDLLIYFLMMMKATTMNMVFSVSKPKFLKRFFICQQRNAISVRFTRKIYFHNKSHQNAKSGIHWPKIRCKIREKENIIHHWNCVCMHASLQKWINLLDCRWKMKMKMKNIQNGLTSAYLFMCWSPQGADM